MAGRGSFLTTRRLLIGIVVFGLFVVFDIALFGYLLFGSLSQREIEAVVLETRADVEPVAQELERKADAVGLEDLYVVMVSRETQSYVDSVLDKRELVRSVEVRDAQGIVVYSQIDEQELPVEPAAAPRIDSVETPADLELEVPPLEEIEVPIGDLGTLVVGLRPERIQERLSVLRRDLIGKASLIAGLTVTLLTVAALAIWFLFQRGRRLEEQALEAERMAYIGTLASGLAHEIRNPLNALNLNMQMLDEEAREGGMGGGAAGRLLAITQSEISRMERLVTDFLSYARPRDLELEEVRAIDLLEQVKGVLAGEIRARGAQVIVEDASDGALVSVDRGQIGQLLLNLAQNALQATERVDRTPQLALVARKQSGSIVLEVADNGVGLSNEAQKQMFDIFYSTRKGGTGLGLAIVQRIAKTHDGRIEVASVEGQGTTMRLLLPRLDGRASITQTITLPVLDDRGR